MSAIDNLDNNNSKNKFTFQQQLSDVLPQKELGKSQNYEAEIIVSSDDSDDNVVNKTLN